MFIWPQSSILCHRYSLLKIPKQSGDNCIGIPIPRASKETKIDLRKRRVLEIEGKIAVFDFGKGNDF